MTVCCPRCGDPAVGATATEPGIEQYAPCGCRVATDGGSVRDEDDDLIVACPECDSPTIEATVGTDLGGRPARADYSCRGCGHRFDKKDAVQRPRKKDVAPRSDSLARTLHDADPDTPITDGGTDDDRDITVWIEIPTPDGGAEILQVDTSGLKVPETEHGFFVLWDPIGLDSGHIGFPDIRHGVPLSVAQDRVAGIQFPADETDTDEDDLVTDGGVTKDTASTLKFADQHIPPIIYEEKTATVRVDGPDLELRERVKATDEDGRVFATLKIREIAHADVFDVLDVLDVFDAKYGADTPNDVLDGLREHYDRPISPSADVDIIVFEHVTLPGDDEGGDE